MSTTQAVNGKEISTDGGSALSSDLEPRSRLLLALLLLLVSSAPVVAQSIQSAYTSLDEKNCKTLRSSTREAGDYEGRCPGVAGYTLLLREGDLRQNIVVVTPQGKKHSLDLWSVISGGFSTVGAKVEWRVRNRRPVALIIRFNASENPEQPDKTTSYLAVAKITPGAVCVVVRIPPGAKANEEARIAADSSSSKPCLKIE